MGGESKLAALTLSMLTLLRNTSITSARTVLAYLAMWDWLLALLSLLLLPAMMFSSRSLSSTIT